MPIVLDCLKKHFQKTMSEFPSYVSEGPTEFVCENYVPVNDFFNLQSKTSYYKTPFWMSIYEFLIIVEVVIPRNYGDIHDVQNVVPDDTFAASFEIGQDSC